MDEMERWLAPLGLAQLAPVLRANDVDLEILPELSEADLEKLGLSLGQRKKLLKAAASLSHRLLSTARSAKPTPSLSAVSSAERRRAVDRDDPELARAASSLIVADAG